MALNVAQLLTPPAGSQIGAVKAGSGVTIDNSGAISVAGAGGVSRINAGNNITLSANTGSVNVSLTTAPAGTNFPSGTVMPFSQASAPTNWSRNTNFDNGMLRLVGGSSGGSTGGSQDFTSAFKSYSPTAAANNPSVSINSQTGNTDIKPNGGADISGDKAVSTSSTLNQDKSGYHTHSVQEACFDGPGTQSLTTGANIDIGSPRPTSFTGGSGPHTHSFNGVQGTFQGNTAQHAHNISYNAVISGITINMSSINLAVRYRDIILCTRN